MSTSTKRRIPMLVAAGAMMLTGVFAASAQAQPVQRTCAQIASLGNSPSLNPQIVTKLNRGVAGRTKKLTRLKTLRVDRLTAISFSGCATKINLKITLKRKIRRDARGNATVTGVVTSASIDSGKLSVCINNPQITSLNLRHLTGVGEKFFKTVGNALLPTSICGKIQL